MVNYKVSIIVPMFNLEDKIEEAFNSIKSQKIGFKNLEVIFIDDKSTDHTLEIVKKLENQHSNVKLYATNKNSGFAGKPRNIGLENASAEYVLFLDGDDELLSNACNVLYDKIKSTNADIVIGGQINVFDGIQQHNPPLLYGQENTYETKIDKELPSISPAITAKLFKRDFLIKNNIKFPEKISGQDLVFSSEALLKSKKTVTLNNFYVYYRKLSGSSVTFSFSEKYLLGLVKAYTLLYDLFEEFKIENKIKEQVFYQHLNFFTLQVLRSQKTNSLTDDELNDIFNSDLFIKLSKKEVFLNNEIFKKYFENMIQGNYNNQDLLKKIYDDEDLISKLYNEINSTKEELSKIKVLELKKSDENNYLKKENKQLNQENIQLKDEITEIKNTKLWKLIKRC